MVKQGKLCLAIGNPSLAPGTPLSLALISGPNVTAAAQVLGATCPEVEVGDPVLRGYEVQLGDASARPYLPALAVVGAAAFVREGDAPSADIDGDGRPESVRACTSSEGVHFTVWSGKPLEGRLLWHQYLYLGYDVESNCTPGETVPANP